MEAREEEMTTTMPEPEVQKDGEVQTAPPRTASSVFERGDWALVLTIAPLAGLFISDNILFLNVFLPLVIWLLAKDKNERANRVGRRVIDSQISWSLYLAIAICAFVALLEMGSVSLGEDTELDVLTKEQYELLLPCLAIVVITCLLWFIFTIRHAVKVSHGEDDYRMPLTIRLFSRR